MYENKNNTADTSGEQGASNNNREAEEAHQTARKGQRTGVLLLLFHVLLHVCVGVHLCVMQLSIMVAVHRETNAQMQDVIETIRRSVLMLLVFSLFSAQSMRAHVICCLCSCVQHGRVWQ